VREKAKEEHKVLQPLYGGMWLIIRANCNTHATTLLYSTLLCSTLYYTTLYYTTLHCTTLETTSRHNTSHYPLHLTTHCTLHYTTLHYTSLHTAHYALPPPSCGMWLRMRPNCTTWSQFCSSHTWHSSITSTACVCVCVCVCD
jgi:uncharacterized membrane protein YozB (DUF420 family)